MAQDPRVEAQLERRMKASAHRRNEVLGHYARGEWLQVAPVEQTANRLRRKGRADVARDLERQAGRIAAAEAAPRSAPGPEAASAPPPVGDPPGADLPRDLSTLGRLVHEQIIGESEIIPARFVHKGSRAARGISRIVTRTLRRPIGTGVLVSPRLLLTNHHVLDSAAGARAHLVQLGYLSREDGTHLAPAEFALDPDLLFLTSPIDELDFTLVAVDPLNTAGARLESFGWSRLIAELGKGVQGERINIVHHPQGTAKGCPGVSVRRYAARNPRSRPV
jgi:hypothetical protein